MKGVPQRPLKEKTLRRIALGIKRYVLDSPKPFIVRCDHGGTHFRGQPLDKPLSTVANHHGYGVVTPFVAHVQNASDEFRGQSVSDPLATTTAKPAGGGLSLVAPTLIQTGYGERDGQAPRMPGLDKPLGTAVSGQKHAMVAAMLSRFNGQKAGESRCHDPAQPISTVDTQNRFGVVAASIAKFYGGVVGHDPNQPLGTVTQVDHHGVVSAHLVKFRGDSDGQAVDQPLPTVTSGNGAARPAGAAHALGLAAASMIRMNHGEKQWDGIEQPLGTITSQGNKFGVVYAFLAKYFGTAIGQRLDAPLGTQTQVDRYGLVTVEVSPGVYTDAVAITVDGLGPCVIADIALRMLRPRELARAQGFRDSYVLLGSTAGQVAKIGNSVPPVMAKALCEANYAGQMRARKREVGSGR
jgi:DNA (cytosine-5)-methyltransferase 1